MSTVEPLADMLTGAAVGRAVEPQTGKLDAEGHTTERNCLNCNTALVGDYCHACGQRGHVHRTLHAFFHDLLHGVFHFEGKIWRTLPMLAWRPGELTRRYVDGQRASFVSPIALFLFSVFLLFAVLSVSGPRMDTVAPDAQEFRKEVAAAEQKVRLLEQERTAAARTGQATSGIDRRLASAREEASMLRTMEQQGIISGAAIRMSDDIPAWLREPVERARKNPDLLLFKLKTNAYKFSWMLIPLSVPFLWLLFPFSRRFHLYDHTVFVTYSLCFMTLLVITAAVLARLGTPYLSLALLIPPVHMYRQLKGAYSLTRIGALWRTIGLLWAAIVVIALFLMILVALGILE